MDERKNTTMKQNKRREKQKKLHETQLLEITHFVKSVSTPGGPGPILRPQVTIVIFFVRLHFRTKYTPTKQSFKNCNTKLFENKIVNVNFFKEVARGGERTWVLAISFIFSFSPLSTFNSLNTYFSMKSTLHRFSADEFCYIHVTREKQ
jgi:hypothetical protein